MNKKDKYIKRLDKIERDLSWVIQYMLKKDQSVSPPPYIPTTTFPPNLAKDTCPKCGIDISGPIGYVCQDINCPVGLGPTISVTY